MTYIFHKQKFHSIALSICLTLFGTSAFAYTALAAAPEEIQKTLVWSTGPASQAVADRSALASCRTTAKALNVDYAASSCKIVYRQTTPGNGAVACDGSICAVGIGDSEQAAKNNAVTNCKSNSKSPARCSVAGLPWRDDKVSTEKDLVAAQAERSAQSGNEQSPARPSAQSQMSNQQAAASSTPSSTALTLLCRLNGGRSYVFSIEEAAQIVFLRDSTSDGWFRLKNGQSTNQKIEGSTTPVSFTDAVSISRDSIQVSRLPDDPLAVLIPGFIFFEAIIDRNSAAIRTGGSLGKDSGICQPWTGRRF